ncbi:MAG: DHA2 family efflux MFS transporter permease subunit [Alphaproteobacteria bacterium]
MAQAVIAPPDVSPRISARSWLALMGGAMGTSTYMTALTITGTAIPHMQGAFSAAPDQIAWLLTAFIVGTTIMTACSGWISGRFGLRRFFLIASGGFAVTTVLCGLSSSLIEAVIFRVMQGMFGAPLLPLGQAIAMNAFPSNRQGLATAMWMAFGNVGSIFGPFVGGVLVENYGWPWVFFVTVPLSLIAFAATWLFVFDTERAEPTKFDWIGFGLLSVTIAALETMLSRGERLLWFDSPEIVAEAAIAALAFYLFAIRITSARAPFVPSALFLNRNYVIGSAFYFVHGAVVFLPLFLLPLQLQSLAGYDIMGVGELLTCRGLGFLAGALLVSRLSDRVDPRLILVLGFGCTAVSTWGMSSWTLEVRAFDVIWAGFINGASSSIAYVPLTVIAFWTLPGRYRTQGLGFFYVVSFLGTATGTAIIFNVLTRSMRINHDVLAERLTPYNELFNYAFVPRLWSWSHQGGVAAFDAEIMRQSMMIAYNNSFYLIALTAIVVLPLIVFIRLPPRR